VVREFPNPACAGYHRRYYPEAEGRWALPHGEFGLDVIVTIGTWRFAEHRSLVGLGGHVLPQDLVNSKPV